MKKKIITCMISFFMLFTIGITSVCAEENLNIDSDSLHNGDTAYMSILDIYKVKLFNNKVSAKKEELQEQKENEKRELYDSIFVKNSSNNISEDDEFVEKVTSYKLFVKAKEQEKIKYIDSKKNNGFFVAAIVVIVFLCISTGILTRLYYLKRRKGEDDKIEYNNYV